MVTLTLRQAVDRALRENAEVIEARMDEIKAQQGVRLARDPFIPRIGIGSGLASSPGGCRDLPDLIDHGSPTSRSRAAPWDADAISVHVPL